MSDQTNPTTAKPIIRVGLIGCGQFMSQQQLLPFPFNRILRCLIRKPQNLRRGFQMADL